MPGENECPGSVKMIYKAYPGGAMTQTLFSLKAGNVLKIQGPLGPGLMISELKGKFLAFAGGTGLVPFLDLIYLVWQNRLTIQDFSLTVYVSFRSRKDGFCLELLERLQEKLPSSVFTLIIATSSEKKKVK